MVLIIGKKCMYNLKKMFIAMFMATILFAAGSSAQADMHTPLDLCKNWTISLKGMYGFNLGTPVPKNTVRLSKLTTPTNKNDLSCRSQGGDYNHFLVFYEPLGFFILTGNSVEGPGICLNLMMAKTSVKSAQACMAALPTM
jgi:hypothetical protein